MIVRDALAAMLRATAPDEAGLPEAERLAAVRPGARQAWEAAFSAWVRDTDPNGTFGHDADALEAMLEATNGGVWRAAEFLVEARIAAQAALAEPEPDTAADQAAVHGMTVGQFVTAKRFHEHETQVALSCPPGVRAGEWEQLNPFGGA